MNMKIYYLPRCWIEVCSGSLVDCWLINGIIIRMTAVITGLALSHRWLLSHGRPTLCLGHIMLQQLTSLTSSIITACKRPTRWAASFWHIVLTYWPLLCLNVVAFCQILEVVRVTSKAWRLWHGTSDNVSEGFTVRQQLVVTDWSHWKTLSFCHAHIQVPHTHPNICYTYHTTRITQQYQNNNHNNQHLTWHVMFSVLTTECEYALKNLGHI